MKIAYYPFLNENIIIRYENNICYGITPCTLSTPNIQNEPNAFSDAVFQQLLEYTQGKRKTFDIPCQLKGTDFQKRVWQALTQIPYGETRSYKDIAIAIGSPNAYRAVGLANNRNPIAIIYPCHRVIGANGKLVGYAGGLEMKQALLDLEQRYK